MTGEATTPRERALAEGRKRYYTGVPCKYGHLSDRYVRTYGCVACENRSKVLWSRRKKQKSY
jgi:hypothetical protein